MGESLSDIGEKEILNRLKRFVSSGQISDDTAEINSLGKKLLINTDVLVEGVHFDSLTTSPSDVGWRAITANISDLAASGVDQLIGVTIGLIAPPETPWNWVEELYVGMKESLRPFQGEILGGDCSKGSARIVAITAIGTLGPLRLHRANAVPGDWIVTSGPHGLSRLGLALLQTETIVQSSSLSNELKAKSIEAHKRPTVPMQSLKNLITSKPKDLPWRAAGTDSSDGLLEAIKNLCESSNCQALIERDKLPTNPEWPLGKLWEEWCLNGGEDFELVLSLPPSWAKEWIKINPLSKAIGIMRAGKPNIFWANNLQKINLEVDFQHF